MITKESNDSIYDLRSRASIERWAAWLFEPEQIVNTCILDSETTDLDGEMIDLAIIGLDGQPVFNSLIATQAAIHPDAQRLHHISEAILKEAPTFLQAWPQIYDTLMPYKRILVYNAKFDAGRLKHTARVNGLAIHCYVGKAMMPPPDVRYIIPGLWLCLMDIYAKYYGDLHPYYGTPRWQRLGDALAQQGVEHTDWHRAFGDCQATLKLLQALAAKYHPEKVEGNDEH